MRLITLGRLVLLDADGAEVPLVGHRRKLALLAFLSLADAPVTREALVAMFWTDEHDDRSRRHSLSNALSFLRGLLGPHAISGHRAEIILAPDAVTTDAVDLLHAHRARDLVGVVELYQGVFLDGVSVGGSPPFDAWAAGTRARIERAVASAAELRCNATAQTRAWDACAVAARRWLEVAPTSAEAALHLLNAIRAGGTPAARAAALAEYDRLVARLAEEYQRTPDARVAALAHRIQMRVAADRAREAGGAVVEHENTAVASTAAVGSSIASAVMYGSDARIADARAADAGAAGALPQAQTEAVAPPMARRLPRRRFRIGAVVAAGVVAGAVVTGLAATVAWSRESAHIHAARPVVAITDIQNLRGDTASAWLQSGLAQMLATDLARSSALDVVDPDHVRQLRVRAELPAAGGLPDRKASMLARDAGATLMVRGQLAVANGVYALAVTVRDIAHDRPVASFTVSAPDPITLADRATAHLLDASAAGSGTVARFADVETSSPAAYQHFVRSQQAMEEGRGAEGVRELDGAIALDSGFGSALLARLDVARAADDTPVVARILPLLARARFTDWDMRTQAVDSTMSNGERARAEQLGRLLVARYPHDPRAYSLLGNLYANYGELSQADAVFKREFALDSLGDNAGRGPCVPCIAYGDAINIEVTWGRLADAEHLARRWVRLEPDLPRSWDALSVVLAFSGQYAGALEAEHHAELLGGGDPRYAGNTMRLLISARDFSAADSLLAPWLRDGSASGSVRRAQALDVLALLQRERGQLRASIRTLEMLGGVAAAFERMDALSRLGRYAEADRLFTAELPVLDAPSVASAGGSSASRALIGDAARSFCWSRAIEADVIAGAGDTVRLRALADSIQDVSTRSYYGRDWRLSHYVRGRIAMQGKRYAEAVREFSAARWGVSGWTVNLAWLARAQMADGRPMDAVATLRAARQGPLDAMGRYEPRSELDHLSAVAFARAGHADSAAVYAGYVRAAWQHADPEVLRLASAEPSS